jgi:hypothetical protein
LKEREGLSEVLSADRPKNGDHIAIFAKPAISMMIATMWKPFVKKEMKSSALEISLCVDIGSKSLETVLSRPHLLNQQSLHDDSGLHYNRDIETLSH